MFLYFGMRIQIVYTRIYPRSPTQNPSSGASGTVGVLEVVAVTDQEASLRGVDPFVRFDTSISEGKKRKCGVHTSFEVGQILLVL